MSICIALPTDQPHQALKVDLTELSKEIVRLRNIWKIIQPINNRNWPMITERGHDRLTAIRNSLWMHYPRYRRLMVLFKAVRNTCRILEKISEKAPIHQERLPNTEFLHGMIDWVDQTIDENNNLRIVLYIPRTPGKSTTCEALQVHLMSLLYGNKKGIS